MWAGCLAKYHPRRAASAPKNQSGQGMTGFASSELASLAEPSMRPGTSCCCLAGNSLNSIHESSPDLVLMKESRNRPFRLPEAPGRWHLEAPLTSTLVLPSGQHFRQWPGLHCVLGLPEQPAEHGAQLPCGHDSNPSLMCMQPPCE